MPTPLRPYNVKRFQETFPGPNLPLEDSVSLEDLTKLGRADLTPDQLKEYAKLLREEEEITQKLFDLNRYREEFAGPSSLPTEDLTKLGNPNARVDRELEVIKISSHPPLEVKLTCTEFTCRCPVTNQPDWANLVIEYVPDKVIVESKSVKLYLETWRDEGIFHEHLAQRVLQDFVAALDPIWCSVAVNFNTRGGIAISATAQYYKGENEDEASNTM